MLGSFSVGDWFQGPTGSGQGGLAAERFERIVGRPISVRLRAPVPLMHELVVTEDDGVFFAKADELVVMTAEPGADLEVDTPTVSLSDARSARARTPMHADNHPVPVCFSCGLDPSSMHVHAGPLGDGRFATDWTVPDWAVSRNGWVDPGALWAALDCTAAVYVGFSPIERPAVTAQYQVQVLRQPEQGETLSIVGFDNAGEWDGRKRHASSMAFDDSGSPVALSQSFWIALDKAVE